MDSIPKFLASIITIIIGVLCCVSFIISAVIVNSARTYHSSVVEEVEACNFDSEIMQEFIEKAEDDNYSLIIESVSTSENESNGIYKISLGYKLSAPILGKIYTGNIVGYASVGADMPVS